jgi:hypothetical protein
MNNISILDIEDIEELEDYIFVKNDEFINITNKKKNKEKKIKEEKIKEEEIKKELNTNFITSTRHVQVPIFQYIDRT